MRTRGGEKKRGGCGGWRGDCEGLREEGGERGEGLSREIEKKGTNTPGS